LLNLIGGGKMDKEIKYSKTYEYIIVDGDTGIVGISAEASDKLGDIYFVELPKIGKQYQMDTEAGVIESVKAASDIFTPVSGEIIEVNGELEKNPQLISGSPMDKGWIFKIRISDKNELGKLMDFEEFKKFINKEGH
jgi:glycine cleavage system H protein